MELMTENERINQENIILKSSVDSLNDTLAKNKLEYQSQADQMTLRFVLENKIKEIESENRSIREDKQRVEIDHKVLQERHLELKQNYEEILKELNFLKIKQTEVRKFN